MTQPTSVKLLNLALAWGSRLSSAQLGIHAALAQLKSWTIFPCQLALQELSTCPYRDRLSENFRSLITYNSIQDRARLLFLNDANGNSAEQANSRDADVPHKYKRAVLSSTTAQHVRCRPFAQGHLSFQALLSPQSFFGDAWSAHRITFPPAHVQTELQSHTCTLRPAWRVAAVLLDRTSKEALFVFMLTKRGTTCDAM
ncbi:hypothetical protein EDB92DRAFT_1902293 [Lactarius akahatsu]|uniref:Secreted protein n=1 Tax=Lactarius akahatsu TaxID=416441 RepID=A0AAD4L8Q6_9AGAM|nr:hypothetical protein EDB92DRAFT_1902293 [Lactarius akahatsu]